VTIHTQFGDGDIVGVERGRMGKTRYKVAGYGFEMWMDATDPAIITAGEDLFSYAPEMEAAGYAEHTPGTPMEEPHFGGGHHGGDAWAIHGTRREASGGFGFEPSGHVFDNSTTLPYDWTPQYPVDGFRDEQTISPDHEIDADERTQWTDSRTGEGRDEPEGPGPNPDLFAKDAAYHDEDGFEVDPEDDPDWVREHSPRQQEWNKKRQQELNLHKDLFAKDAAHQDEPCGACGADAGEECRPYCTGKAAYDDERHTHHESSLFHESGGIVPLDLFNPDKVDLNSPEYEDAARLEHRLRSEGPDRVQEDHFPYDPDTCDHEDEELLGDDTTVRCNDCGNRREVEHQDHGDDPFAHHEAKWERPAGLGDRYASIPDAPDHSEVGRFRQDPYGAIVRKGSMELDAGLDRETGEWMDLVLADRSIRTAAWKDVRQKAVRILRDGGVHVKASDSNAILASVDGDHATYEVMILNGSAYPNGGFSGGKRAIANWKCGCEWGKWAFKRKFTFVGRLCSHGYATYLAQQSQQAKTNPHHFKKRKGSVVDEFKSWAKENNDNHVDMTAADNFLTSLEEPATREQAEQVFDFVQGKDSGCSPSWERDYDQDGYGNNPDDAYKKKADVLKHQPHRLTPNLYWVPELSDEQNHYFTDLGDDRETTGPDQIMASRRRAGLLGPGADPRPEDLDPSDYEDPMPDTAGNHEVCDNCGAPAPPIHWEYEEPNYDERGPYAQGHEYPVTDCCNGAPVDHTEYAPLPYEGESGNDRQAPGRDVKDARRRDRRKLAGGVATGDPRDYMGDPDDWRSKQQRNNWADAVEGYEALPEWEQHKHERKQWGKDARRTAKGKITEHHPAFAWHAEGIEDMPKDGIVHFSSLKMVADEDLLNRLRDLSNDEPSDHFQDCRDHNDEVRNVVDELHERGFDASPLVAMKQAALWKRADDDDEPAAAAASSTAPNAPGTPGGQGGAYKSVAPPSGSVNTPRKPTTNAQGQQIIPSGPMQGTHDGNNGTAMAPPKPNGTPSGTDSDQQRQRPQMGGGAGAANMMSMVPTLLGEGASLIPSIGSGIGSALSGLTHLFHGSSDPQRFAKMYFEADGAFLTKGGPNWMDYSFAGSGPNRQEWSTTSEDYVKEHERPRHNETWMTDCDGDVTVYSERLPQQKKSRRVRANGDFAGSGDAGYGSLGGVSAGHLSAGGSGEGLGHGGFESAAEQSGGHTVGDLSNTKGASLVYEADAFDGGERGYFNPNNPKNLAYDKGDVGLGEVGPKRKNQEEDDEEDGEGGGVANMGKPITELLKAVPKAASLDDSDVVRRFHASGGGFLDEPSHSDDGIAAAAQKMLRTAGRNYTPAEQRELEDESHPKGARNLGSLDLRGTHYEDG